MMQDPTRYGLPAYPDTPPAGPCVCGSWPGGACLRCPVIPVLAENHCDLAPPGWVCSRTIGHDGACVEWPLYPDLEPGASRGWLGRAFDWVLDKLAGLAQLFATGRS